MTFQLWFKERYGFEYMDELHSHNLQYGAISSAYNAACKAEREAVLDEVISTIKKFRCAGDLNIIDEIQKLREVSK